MVPLVPPMAPDANTIRSQAVISRSNGRCECAGECAGNHRWEPGQPPVRCGAPHGCNVVRKKDNPSYWCLASLQGFRGDMEGPRTHAQGRYVTEGVKVTFVHGDEFDKRITQVWLVVSEEKALCQHCARETEKGEPKTS